MTETMEWLSNFNEEIDKWIESIDFGDIMTGAQQTEEQHAGAVTAPLTEENEATMAPPAEDATHEAEDQQLPHTETEMDYALQAISLVQQVLPLMNEAFKARAKAQEEEIARLKEAVARLEKENNNRPTSPRVVINNRGRNMAPRVSKRPRAPRKKGMESQEQARRAHRAPNARKWRAKKREEERQKEAESTRKRGLRWSNRTVILLSK